MQQCNKEVSVFRGHVVRVIIIRVNMLVRILVFVCIFNVLHNVNYI